MRHAERTAVLSDRTEVRCDELGCARYYIRERMPVEQQVRPQPISYSRINTDLIHARQDGPTMSTSRFASALCVRKRRMPWTTWLVK
jgi:hypothetical protein